MDHLAEAADRAAMLACEQRFFDALIAGDTAVLDEALADDFLLVAIDNGAVVSKAALIDAVASGAVAFPAVETFHDEAVVRRIGEVGIVVGRTGMSFTGADGVAFTAGSRYTHVFAHTAAAGWRLVSGQGTSIASAA